MLYFTSACDLDVRGRDAGVGHDTLSNYSDYLCQVFLKSFDLWKSYRPDTDYVKLWAPSVTLTLEVVGRLLHWTHRLIIVNNCCKYLQNPFKDKKVMDRTRHIPSNRKCWPWISKNDIDPGGKDLVVAHDASPYCNKYLF
jgi:hypothetical protein